MKTEFFLHCPLGLQMQRQKWETTRRCSITFRSFFLSKLLFFIGLMLEVREHLIEEDKRNTTISKLSVERHPLQLLFRVKLHFQQQEHLKENLWEYTQTEKRFKRKPNGFFQHKNVKLKIKWKAMLPHSSCWKPAAGRPLQTTLSSCTKISRAEK